MSEIDNLAQRESTNAATTQITLENLIQRVSDLDSRFEQTVSDLDIDARKQKLDEDKYKLDRSKQRHDIRRDNKSHVQATRHKTWEFYVFITVKIAVSAFVIYFIFKLSNLSFDYIEYLKDNFCVVDEKISMTIIIGGLSSSVILLALLMKGVFSTKTETTTSDIPVGGVIKSIMDAFRSSGKS